MNKRKGMFLLLIVLLLVTVGFALLSRKLNIFGTSNITAASWNIHWDNVANQKGVEASTPAYIKDTAKTIVEYEVNFEEPGDYYEFTVDAVNEGTMDGKITRIESTVNGEDISTLPSYITYSVSYLEGGTPALGDILTKKVGNTPGKKTYKIRVEYDADLVTETDLDDMPNDGLTLVFEYDVVYSQANSMSQPMSFVNDPWDEIAEAGNEAAKQTSTNGSCGTYNLGDTKEIDLGDLGVHTVRIANCSTPAVCKTEGFSQTACGFVLEFTDIITTHIMNPLEQLENYGDGNIGGWEHSNMRYYLNNGIYSKLPADLRASILDTTVISGHGSKDGANFNTTDKLYLLSSHEVFVDPSDRVVFKETDTAYDNTRQLDYYEINNTVLLSDSSSAMIKQYNGSNDYWWFRTPNSKDYYTFLFAWKTPGNYSNIHSNYEYGVSPAFKLK